MIRIPTSCKKIFVSKNKKVGYGIFTNKRILKGKFIVAFKGKIKTKIIKNEKDSRLFIGTRLLGLSKTKWLHPNKYDPLYYINHSCNPSSGIKGKVSLYALRNINENEEITLDYSTSEEDIFWKMKCKCGSSKCRKIIRPIQFLPDTIYKKYLPFIPNNFKKAYERYKKINTKKAL